MKRTLIAFLLAFLTGGIAWAQQLVVRGVVQEAKTGVPVAFATASLLNADSVARAGVNTDTDGRFTLKVSNPGTYKLRLSYVGFKPVTQSVELQAGTDTLDVGIVEMESTDNQLGTATVSVTASRVEQKDDTTMFNAAAYRVPEGSTLESLIKQLPGVEVSDDGTITWNGKTVKEFLINGKDFFKGDTQTAMKNLPTDLVSKIKAYDKQSDYTAQTGIDDGEETTVLDITTKHQLKESWITNADVAYGNHDRYSGRVFITRFTDRSSIAAFGSMNNTNDMGFGGPRGFGGGSSGLVATKNAGLNFSWENGKERREAGRFEVGGSVRYRFTDSDALSTSNSETFLSSGGSSSFGNSSSHDISKSTTVDAQLRLEWNPDSMTNINFRPQYTYSRSRSNGSSLSSTFNDDPYSVEGISHTVDSLVNEAYILSNPALAALLVNTNSRLSQSLSTSHSVSGSLNAVRRLNSKGRNVSLQLTGGYTKEESESFSISKISYGEASNQEGSFLNQYSNTPSVSYNYSARIGYVEPIAKNWYAEARYQFSYKYSDSDRSRYNLDSLSLGKYTDLWPEYGSYGDPDNYPALGSLPTLDEALNAVRDLNNSQYATYKYYNHTATAGVRYNTKAIRFSAGVDFNPEKTKMAYNRPGQNIDTLITRNVFKVSPSVRFRYKFSQTSQLDIRYRGSSSQPSMTDLLAVVDDSDPLNISMGNPGLKPSWSNSLRVHYNGYNASRQQGVMTGIDFTQTSNSISNRMVYDETTGVRYLRPDNINGNWEARGIVVFNSGIGAQKLFNISTFTMLSYDNSVGYVSTMESGASAQSTATLIARPTATADVATSSSYDYYNNIFNSAISEKNTTRTFTVDENLNASYRASWFDVGLLGRLNYQHARATVQDNANMDTWNFAYGANANFVFDFGLSISTDIRMNSRRGYSDASMNTNELLWNAQIAQSFLKNNAATISIQFYDILQQQSNVSRTLSATMRQDSWTNAINSYFMVHFIYKLNIFAGGAKSGDGRRNGDGPMGPPDMRGPGGMPMRPMSGGGGGPGGRF